MNDTAEMDDVWAKLCESGEGGETPSEARDTAWRKDGEGRRRKAKASPGVILEIARARLDVQPLAALDYPTDALGPLAPACEAIAEGGQMASAMAGQSLLATSALLAQSCADVRTLAGIKPLSIYGFTIADSGDGKSTAEGVAMKPIRDRQREEAEAHRQQIEEYQRAKASRKKGEPLDVEVGRPPYRIMRDGTVEGIRAGFQHGMPSQGVFTSEAAIMVSGYGMTPDNRAKTCGTFNALWDDGEVSVSRSLTGRIQLYGRRLSLHWLIQPEAARSALHDPLMAGIGFWPRFLIAWPAPAAPRKALPFHAEHDGRIRGFWSLCERLLDRPLGEECSDLPVIEATTEAESLACKFFERMEIAAKSERGELATIKPFAVRATEHVFRVAGVLAVIGGRDLIDLEAMRNAIRLVSYSLDTWRSIFGDREQAETHAHALHLLEWIVKLDGMKTSETAILRIGPRATRSKSRRDTALAVLEQVGVIERLGSDWQAVEVQP
ncbi:DUF3987 domain-containing protein [Thauera sp. WH-2]|uniref:DUF3987 domain-containing protein n=1 Tax=Thauera sp. WH-2 TaxID=3401574 RepID=UPI003AAD7A98